MPCCRRNAFVAAPWLTARVICARRAGRACDLWSHPVAMPAVSLFPTTRAKRRYAPPAAAAGPTMTGPAPCWFMMIAAGRCCCGSSMAIAWTGCRHSGNGWPAQAPCSGLMRICWCPCPCTRWRLLRRRYNQAGLLSRALCQHCGIPSYPNLLQRWRATPSQGCRSRAGARAMYRVPLPCERLIGLDFRAFTWF